MEALPQVIALHLCAKNDVNGNPRRCFVVLDARGRTVETIDEGYAGEGALYSRWPMFNWHSLRRHLGVSPDLMQAGWVVYPHRVDVTATEYNCAMRRDPHPECADLRKWADRVGEVV